MIITAIEEINKSKSKVFLDGEFAFALYKGELREYRMEVGGPLSEAAYEEILHKVLPKRAKLRAMNLLQKREYTEMQLRRKLMEGFYPEECIEEALAYVASFHYTDDLRYAVSYIEDHEDSKSRLRMEQDLMAKGISKTVLEQAWLEWEEKGGSQNEEKMIRDLLEKRHFDAETADFSEIQKQYAFLMRKGFSGEAVRKVLRECETYD